MITLDTDAEVVREETKKVINSLTKNEFIGLIFIVLNDLDIQKQSIWDRVEPIFVEDPTYEFPTPHPEAVVVMGEIAKERRTLGE